MCYARVKIVTLRLVRIFALIFATIFATILATIFATILVIIFALIFAIILSIIFAFILSFIFALRQEQLVYISPVSTLNKECAHLTERYQQSSNQVPSLVPLLSITLSRRSLIISIQKPPTSANQNLSARTEVSALRVSLFCVN